MEEVITQNAAIPVAFTENLPIELLDKCDGNGKIYLIFKTPSSSPDNMEDIKEKGLLIQEVKCIEQHKQYSMKLEIKTSDIPSDVMGGHFYFEVENSSYVPIGRFMYVSQVTQFGVNIHTDGKVTLNFSMNYPFAGKPIIKKIPFKELTWEKQTKWQEKYIGETQINSSSKYGINLSVSNISTVFNNQSSLYFLYKAKNRNNFYMGIFELTEARMIGVFQLPSMSGAADKNFHLKAIGTKATGTDAERTQVTWHLSHSSGLLRLHVFDIDTTINNSFKEVYSDLTVSEGVTVTKFKDYHYLSGGDLSGWVGYYGVSSNEEETVAPYIAWYTYGTFDNPITEYAGEYIHTIGGSVPPVKYFMERRKPVIPKPNEFKNTRAMLYEYSQIVQVEIPDSIVQSEFNSQNFRSTVVGNKIYIFPVGVFKKQNYFYVYDANNKKFIPYKVPSDIVDKVKNNSLASYSDIQVTTAESSIFFTLTKSDSETLGTQIISFYTEKLDE